MKIDIDLDDESNLLGNQEVCGIMTREISVSIIEMQYDRPATNIEHWNWMNNDVYKNDHIGVYVSWESTYWVSSRSSGFKFEDIAFKVLQKYVSTNAGAKEMTCDFSNMSQLLESRTTSIKKI